MASRRAYHSPTRRRQADETRRRILDAARRLALRDGYPGMTFEGIANLAGVAPQTVRAVFGSKPRILAAMLERAAHGVRYEDLVQEALHSPSPQDHLRSAARIARHIYEGVGAELSLLRAAGAVVPELNELELRLSQDRRTRQAPVIEHVVRAGALRAGLDRTSAADVLWALTSHDLYRMLVRDRSWAPARYEEWLAEQLTTSLLGTAPGAGPPAPGLGQGSEGRSPVNDTEIC